MSAERTRATVASGNPPANTGEGALRAGVDRMLRACIQCGLCLPHCATYLATGNEAQSPRGRLLLLGETLGEPAHPPRPPDASTLEAFDLCLGCRACVTACPSGITHDLLDAVKEVADRERRSRSADPLVALLASRGGMGAVGAGVRLGRGALRALYGRGWRQRLERSSRTLRLLARQVGSAPAAPRGDRELVRLLDRLVASAAARSGSATTEVAPSPRVMGGRTPAAASSKGAPKPAPAVAFFRGCANAAFLPDTSRRLQELLAAGGCRITTPPGQGCCGALAEHAGRQGLARRQRRSNAAALQRRAETWDVLVVEAAGCGLELKRYPEGIRARVRDALVLLDALPLPAPRPVPLRVVCHDPCHALHGQGIAAEPRRLLDRIPGLVRLDADEPDVCCGSGGPYAILHPDLSTVMARRKAEKLAATGADLVVTSNPGCLGQIADGLALVAPDLPVLPLSDLLWYARLGGRPPGGSS